MIIIRKYLLALYCFCASIIVPYTLGYTQTADMARSIYDPTHKSAIIYNTDNHYTGSVNSVFTLVDKAKLDGIGAGAAVSSFNGRTGAVVPATNDYTWAQINKTVSTIADITTRSHTALTDIGTNTHAQIDSHIANTSNPHSVTATQVGLGNVLNIVQAPASSKFLVQGTADAGLSGAQFMGALGTGIVKNTTTTGVQSIAIAADFPTLNQDTTGTATNAANTAITDDTTTNATMYPTWVTANTGNLPQKVSSTKLYFNPSTGLLTATGFSGPLTGNVTGDVSGSSGSCTGNAATATKLAATKNINGTAFDGSADITVPVNNANDATTNATMYPLWSATQGGNYAAKSSSNLTFNPSNSTLTATTFSGALSGNATSATSATTATNATNITTTDDTTTNSDYYPTFQTATGGTNPLKTSSTKLTYHPSTGAFSSTTFIGALTGNVTGNASGSSGSCTGNSATVTGFSPTAGKTLSVSKTMTLTAADDTGSYTLPTGTKTIPAATDVHYIGTTSIALNRASAAQALTGITSIDGSAATLTTARAIYGNNFDGSAALAQVIASTYGGTGNGFTKFSGPTTAEKTFTLPDSSSTLLYSGGALGTPSSGTLTNCTFPTLNQDTTGTATNATNSAITDDVATNATMYPTWVTTASGNQAIKTSSTLMTWNPSTKLLTVPLATVAAPSGTASTIKLSTVLTTSYEDFQFQENGSQVANIYYINSAFATTNRQQNLEIFNRSTSGGVTTYCNSNPYTFVDVTGHVSIANGGTTLYSPTAWLQLRAGTTAASQAPLKFLTGSLQTTPEVGAVEFLAGDTTLSFTPNASNRGVVNTTHFTALTADFTGVNDTSNQKVFNATTNGTITLPSSATYKLEAQYVITRAAGTTSHTISTLFGGTATLTDIMYTIESTSSTGNILTAPSMIYATVATATVVTAASTSATENIILKLNGIVRINAGGTFIPQVTYSAAPGGAPTFLKDSYIMLTPIGSKTVSNVGNWS